MYMRWCVHSRKEAGRGTRQVICWQFV